MSSFDSVLPATAGAVSRRHAVRRIALGAACALLPYPVFQLAAVGDDFLSATNEHPEPRPGIDGSRVVKAEQLRDTPDAIDAFDGIRQIPHIADGIRCYCGCAQIEGYRSLLSCYEGDGMARWCEICQGQGRLAYRRFREGQTLAQIRRATDARYGHGGHAPAPVAPANEHCQRR